MSLSDLLHPSSKLFQLECSSYHMIGSKYAMNILFGILLFYLPFDFIVNAVLQGILSLNLSDPKKY